MIDVQSSQSLSAFAIDRVGVKRLKYPFLFKDVDSGVEQKTVGEWTLSVALPKDRRGTHMSRLIERLHDQAETPWTLEGLYRWAESLKVPLEAEVVDIKVEFTIFRLVMAPVSKKPSYLEHPVVFHVQTGPNPRKTMVVDTYVKTLCPCSKAISERGAHNQRSLIRTYLHYPVPKDSDQSKDISVLALGGLVEQCASSPVYPILKRADEKYVTEMAYDHPGFVEDVVREVAQKVVDLEGLMGFTVEVTNYESIHAHDCYGKISWQSPRHQGVNMSG